MNHEMINIFLIDQIGCWLPFLFMIRGLFFMSSSQTRDSTLEHRRKYSGICPESSFNHDSKYVIKNVVSPIQKQKYRPPKYEVPNSGNSR